MINQETSISLHASTVCVEKGVNLLLLVTYSTFNWRPSLLILDFITLVQDKKPACVEGTSPTSGVSRSILTTWAGGLDALVAICIARL